MKKRKICIISGSRADYGLLYWVIKELQFSTLLEPLLVVTGMHLSHEFGSTVSEIEKDNFRIDSRVEMLLSSDSSAGVAKSVGLGVIGFSDSFSLLKPDLILILGDRFEIFAAVQTALFQKIPVAHIAGGDITEGAFDESIRHSISKMSHIHFPTNEQARHRLMLMGENPKYIFNVGSPGIDYIKRMNVISRAELEKQLNVSLREKNILITLHPTTIGKQKDIDIVNALLDALSELDEKFGLIFTLSNADPAGRMISERVRKFVEKKTNAWAFQSLGQHLFLNLLSNVNMVVGNSSSGLYEAPSFKIPTVNIGERQRGRLRASSVIDCFPSSNDIQKAINSAMQLDCSQVINPYGEGNSSREIRRILESIDDYNSLLSKHFYIQKEE
ncbi:MAG: UDP-N-acetylglucosamine 2-epimerase (hydrolyzing) [Candidatus Riflebacteria bacterium]|nr:UDP-N-acetylglucosamine 2-epimerase (hydrolyzing) [Candidatus Riflebacteria bacterium]